MTRLYAYLAILAVIGASLGGVYVKGRMDGKNACTGKYERLKQEQKDKARETIVEVNKDYERKINAIQNSDGGGDLVGDTITRAIDGLYDSDRRE